MSAIELPPGCEPTRYTWIVPRPSFPLEGEEVSVIARRGGWDRGPIEAWNIVDHMGSFWTRERCGFAYRPMPAEIGRWTLAEALREAADHAVPWMARRIAEDEARIALPEATT